MTETKQEVPLFCKSLMSKEQVKDYLEILVAENRKRIELKIKLDENAQTSSGNTVSLLSLKDTAAKFIIHVCANWKISVDVQIVSIEMYYYFITELLNSLFFIIFGSSNKPKSSEANLKQGAQFQNNQWNQTIEHIIGQMELRAITCIAIASKFMSHYSYVTYDMAIRLLASNGRKYSPDVLLKSEIRILKTINYNVCSLPVPLAYIHALLDCLVKNGNRFVGQEFFNLSTNLLLCFYSCSFSIYERYLKLVEKIKDETELNLKVLVVSKDMVLLSSAIISSASYIFCRKSSDEVIKHLNDITKISQKSIAKLSYIILEEILH